MSTTKPAGETTQPEIHRLIRERWSPRAFADRPVEPAQLRSLLEAARWAASAFNDQPWYFIVASGDDPGEYQQLLDCLVEANKVWAQNAPVLMLAVARTSFSHNGESNRHALYDTGQAVATLTLQASELGLRVHQMGGFDPDQACATYGIPQGYEAVTVLAVGYQGDPRSLPDQLQQWELAERTRRPLAETVFSGRWGTTAKLLDGGDD